MEGIDLARIVDSDFQGIQINFAPPRPAGFANFRRAGRGKTCFFAGCGGAHIPGLTHLLWPMTGWKWLTAWLTHWPRAPEKTKTLFLPLLSFWYFHFHYEGQAGTHFSQLNYISDTRQTNLNQGKISMSLITNYDIRAVSQNSHSGDVY